MKIEKKVISNLPKCYAIAPLHYKGQDNILVAAEKKDRCILFDTEGNELETVWTEPGGVMTMLQVPNGPDGQFLATHKFFSPNDAKEAKIVVVTPDGNGNWNVQTLCDLPFVHRFGILERNGVNYLIACSVKGDMEYKDDWRFPGAAYAAVLPDDLSVYNDEHQLELKVIKDNMVKNHGYYLVNDEGVNTAIVSSNEGIFQFIPPVSPDAEWEIKELVSDATSDAVLMDIDGDGEKEIFAIAPFHGDKVRCYKKQDGEFKMVYEFAESREFLHSIYGGQFGDKMAFVTGHRKGARDLMAFFYNKETNAFEMEYIDRDCGSANVYHFLKDGKDMLVSTNREIDEAALYTITEI